MSADILWFKEFRVRTFPSETYRWICTFEYYLTDATCSSETILTALLQDEHYAHAFMSPFRTGSGVITYLVPDGNVPVGDHKVRGPYLLDRLTPDSFDEINAEGAWEQIDEFLGGGRPPNSRSDLDLNTLVGNAFDTADELFRLREDVKAQHDVAWVISDWSELVVMDRSAKKVLNLAFGSD